MISEILFNMLVFYVVWDYSTYALLFVLHGNMDDQTVMLVKAESSLVINFIKSKIS